MLGYCQLKITHTYGTSGAEQNLPSELGVLGDEVDHVQVELKQTVVDWSTIPIRGDSLPSLCVRQVAILSVNSKYAFQCLLVWVCNLSAQRGIRHDDRGSLNLLSSPSGFSEE